MDWKMRLSKKKPNTLPFDTIRVSDDKKFVTLMKKHEVLSVVTVEEFLKFIDSLEQEGLSFNRAGFLNLIGQNTGGKENELRE